MKKFKKFMDLYGREYSLKDYMGYGNINLGCGNRPMENFVNVDYYNKKYADVIADLNKRLPFENESADLIYSDNVFEHIDNLILLVKECHRVLRKGAHLVVRVPYFKSKHAFIDPTHKIFFTVQSMDFYVKATPSNKRGGFFDETYESVNVYLDPGKNSLIKRLVSIYAITRPNRFENSILSNIFVFHNIFYVLRK